MKIFEANEHFNIANIVTFLNISCGIIAIYLSVNHHFALAATLAWIAGAFDIIDGKLARRYNLSTEFGVQLDSFADFISFVIMPAFFLFFAFSQQSTPLEALTLGLVLLWYIISGLRRLVTFNLISNAGDVAKYFIGVPTPLGAILLWCLWLLSLFGIVTNIYILSLFILCIAYLLNSQVRIPHP